MLFYKKEKSAKKGVYPVYMENNSADYYVCDMVDGDTEEAKTANELGLTLRARLVRSKGKYAMLEGTIFNPERLMDSCCSISDFKNEKFEDKDCKLLTITADNCTNKYLIFCPVLLKELLEEIDSKIEKK